MIVLTERQLVHFLSKFSFGNKDQCWFWESSLTKWGYGLFRWGDKRFSAHRFSYMYFRGDPGDLFVLHSCDNRNCINPNHLFLGTQLDNMRDMDDKGRRAIGENNGKSKLTNKQAVEIRKQYAMGNYSQVELAELFGVGRKTIGRIIREVSYQAKK